MLVGLHVQETTWCDIPKDHNLKTTANSASLWITYPEHRGYYDGIAHVACNQYALKEIRLFYS